MSKAQLLLRVNSGAWTQGYVTAANGDTISLQLGSLDGSVRAARFEIWSYPDGYDTSPPSGWTKDTTNQVAVLYAITGGLPPPTFQVTATNLGKWLVRVLVDVGRGFGVPLIGTANDDLIDQTGCVEIVSANGLHDWAYGEDSQANPKGPAGLMQENLRLIDAAFGGGGGGGVPPIPSGSDGWYLKSQGGAAVWLPQAGFVVSSFAGPSAQIVGATVTNPAFTAAYSVTPDTTANSVVITNTDGTSSPRDVTSTPTSFSIPGSFQKTSVGASTTFTNTAKKGTLTAVGTYILPWYNHIMWGLLASPAATQANFDSLQAQFKALSNSRDGSFAFASGSGYPCVAIRTALGLPTQWTIGPTVQTLATIGSASWANSLSPTTFTESYTLVAMSSTGLGAFTLVGTG